MNKYKNGYLPKIEFWKGKLNLAIEAGNVEGVTTAAQKVLYFMTRQEYVYGKTNVIAGVDFSESLDMLAHLGRS